MFSVLEDIIFSLYFDSIAILLQITPIIIYGESSGCNCITFGLERKCGGK
jgi:hypothetical protein